MAIFNNSPRSIYVNNYCIVSLDVIRSLRGNCDKQFFTVFLTKSFSKVFYRLLVLLLELIIMLIAVFAFFYSHDFLCFTLDLYIPGSLKYLTTSVSIKNIDTTNSLFLWVPYLILFFVLRDKTLTWLQAEACPSCLGFFSFKFLFFH